MSPMRLGAPVIHFIDVGLERLGDLALDHRSGRGRRQDAKPEPYDQSLCLHNSGGGDGRCLHLLCRPPDVVHMKGITWN